jgi:DNA-binding NarL/FixJ family response regulator
MIPTQHRSTLSTSPAARPAPADLASGADAGSPGASARGAAANLAGAAGTAPPQKVLLVDDHDLMRLGIKALIDEGVASCTIEWIEASSLGDAMKLCEEHPDIALVLLDLNLADCKGLQGLSQLLGRHPQTRVIILSGTQDEFVVRQAKAMGAVGYLHKAAAPALARDVLLGALGVPGTAQHPRNVAARFPKSGLPSRYDLVAQLGPRHLEILELVLCGCTNQEISNETKLSLGTVKNYVSTILLALDVRSRSHLISLFR